MNATGAGCVGASTVSITPEHSLTWGAATLSRDRTEDSDLLAHAVAFTDGSSVGAIVSTDLTMIDRAHFLAIRELASLRSGIPAEHITIAANHVHLAPSTAPGWTFKKGAVPDPIYVEFLADRIADAVASARRGMTSAVLSAGEAATTGLSFNRRYRRPDGSVEMVFSPDRDPSWPPAGPADPNLGYLFFERPDGSPIALMTSFSAHNHVVGGSPVPGRGPAAFFHRDFGGRFGDAVRRALGAPIPTVYLAGAGGNTSWQDPATAPPVDGPAAASRIGSALAGFWLDEYRSAARRNISDLRFASEVIEIPDRPLSESGFCDDLCRGRDAEIREFDRVRAAAERAAIEERGDGTACQVEIGAISMSDVAISTNPAELFVEYGIEIKDRSPFDVTLVAELANGWCGYVPTEKAFAEGGYETHRSVFVSRLAKNAGRIITDRSVEALERCRELQ